MNSSPSAPLYVDRICFECVGEAYLKNLIQQEGTPDECSYCGENGPTISVQDLANHVERAFEDHYERTSPDPEGWEISMHSDRESEYNWERSGEPARWAISNALEVEDGIADDVLSILTDRHYDHYLAVVSEECEFSEESHYRERTVGNGEFRRLWNEFERGLKTEARYFSRSAHAVLEQIFSKITELRTTRGASVVVKAGPSRRINSLYRARVFAGEFDKLEEALKEPWKHLGTPPSHSAGAGRMNARGISVFYGALNPKTALAEVRPPVGSQVAIARFQISRELRLLDLNALQSVAAGGSIFNPETTRQMQRANFLEVLSQLMSRAIMPHEEASEYLPTQAVAEYLANEIGLDGMIFPSIQAGQKASNVVLFHHASRVEEVTLPYGTKIDASLEAHDSDGVHAEYTVWERVPVEAPNKQASQTLVPWDFDLNESAPSDQRKNSLRIDLEAIQVLHISSVHFRSDTFPVDRQRFEGSNHLIFGGAAPATTGDDFITDDLFSSD